MEADDAVDPAALLEFSPDEIRRLRALLEVEEIRKVRLLYAHLLDGGDVDALSGIFTEDAVCEFGPYGTWRGRSTIRANYQAVYDETLRLPFGALHNNVNHHVQLMTETTAVGRSYLIDVITQTPRAENPIVWFGLYDEEYLKVDGSWQIARVALQFLWPERHVTPGFPGRHAPSV